MTNAVTSAGVIGAVSAVGTAALQATGAASTNTTLIVPIVSAIIGGVMSYAVLKTTVSKMERDMRDMRKDMSDIYTLVRESLTKVAKLEGRLDSHS